jgi:hypothetical protein
MLLSLIILREYIKKTIGDGGLVGKIITPIKPIYIEFENDYVIFKPGLRYIITSENPIEVAREAMPYQGLGIKRHYSTPPVYAGKSQSGFPSGHYMYSKGIMKKAYQIKDINKWEILEK